MFALSAGLFSRPAHALYGESYVGRVLVLNVAKGGVARAWRVLREEDPASASVFAYHGRFDLECSEMLTVTHV